MKPDSSGEERIADFLLPPKFESRTDKIREHRTRPDILVRERRIQGDENAEKMMADAVEAKQLFERMGEEYGIRVVSMEHFGGKDEEGETAIFTVVDKIDGQNLEEITELPPEAKDELEGLYMGLAEHCEDAWNENEKFWSDANNSQFVYGNKVGEKEKHFYLVDVEPHFHRPGENALFPVAWPILQISRGLVDAERKFGAGMRLEKARAKLAAIIEKMSKDGSDPVLADAVSALEGRESGTP